MTVTIFFNTDFWISTMGSEETDCFSACSEKWKKTQTWFRGGSEGSLTPPLANVLAAVRKRCAGLWGPEAALMFVTFWKQESFERFLNHWECLISGSPEITRFTHTRCYMETYDEIVSPNCGIFFSGVFSDGPVGMSHYSASRPRPPNTHLSSIQENAMCPCIHRPFPWEYYNVYLTGVFSRLPSDLAVIGRNLWLIRVLYVEYPAPVPTVCLDMCRRYFHGSMNRPQIYLYQPHQYVTSTMPRWA